MEQPAASAACTKAAAAAAAALSGNDLQLTQTCRLRAGWENTAERTAELHCIKYAMVTTSDDGILQSSSLQSE
jgi:hypothetical protein